MGLLDDAIREHLELKRQHGADPGEVARQEREAFGAAQQRAAEEAAATPEVADEAPVFADAPPPVEAAAPFVDEPPVDEPEVEEAPRAAAPAPAPPAPEPVADDIEVDWSEPARDPEPAAEPEDDRSEDVLEETPDFLQETPEHDRLWFEQRPPRDFDF